MDKSLLFGSHILHPVFIISLQLLQNGTVVDNNKIFLKLSLYLLSLIRSSTAFLMEFGEHPNIISTSLKVNSESDLLISFSPNSEEFIIFRNYMFNLLWVLTIFCDESLAVLSKGDSFFLSLQHGQMTEVRNVTS